MNTDAHAIVYDALEQTKKLKNVGFSDDQAEALARGMRDVANCSRNNFATKADVAVLNADIAAVEAGMTALEDRMTARLCRALWIQGAGTIVIFSGLFTAFRFIP